jgi:hypothetical protein
VHAADCFTASAPIFGATDSHVILFQGITFSDPVSTPSKVPMTNQPLKAIAMPITAVVAVSRAFDTFPESPPENIINIPDHTMKPAATAKINPTSQSMIFFISSKILHNVQLNPVHGTNPLFAVSA